MTSVYSQHLASEQDMMALAARMAACLEDGTIIYLFGELGAGKTTFTRGLLRGLGYTEKVKSPTYTLVEPYDVQGRKLVHCDFYRLDDPNEIEHLGVREFIGTEAICIIEWAEKGFPLLPEPDIACYIEFQAETRQIKIEARSPRGQALLCKLAIE